VDQWPARRRISRPAAGVFWDPLLGDRRLAEGEAMFQQFQDQIGDFLRSSSSLSPITAKGWFKYLPLVGMLPLSTGGARGFDYSAFFSQLTYRKPVFIEGAALRPLLREAVEYPPIETSSGLVLW